MTNAFSVWVDSLGALVATAKGIESYDGYRWERTVMPDSLNQQIPTDVLRSKDGAIWLATDAGRFDGVDWRIYGPPDALPDGHVGHVGLHGDEDGTMWAGFGSPWVGPGYGKADQRGVVRFRDGVWESDSPPDVVSADSRSFRKTSARRLVDVRSNQAAGWRRTGIAAQAKRPQDEPWVLSGQSPHRGMRWLRAQKPR